MIRPLRQRHRAIVCALAALLPAAFGAGLAARRPVPVATSVPASLSGRAHDFGTVVWTKKDLWPGERIVASLRRDDAGSMAVELMFRDLARPDVLVYWAAGKEPASEGLPENARFLGSLSSHTLLPIPPEVHDETGRFVLYSLADHEVVAVSTAFNIHQH